MFKKIAALTIFFIAGTSTALATPVTLLKQNPYDTFDGGGSAPAKIYNQTPNVSASVRAGGFRLSNGVSDFIAWCLDITHSLKLPSKYNVTETPFSNSYRLTSTQKANVENLFETNYTNLDLNDGAQSAGFQLALWEVVYEDTANFNVSNGTFHAWANSSVLGFANQFLGNLGGNILQNYDFDYYESVPWKKRRSGVLKQSQNLVSVTPVPIPAAGLLLGGGMLAMFFFARRKKA